jgi:hypothetical protein
LDAGPGEVGFGFFGFLGFGEATARESSSDSSVGVTEGLGVGLGDGVAVVDSGDVIGVGVTVATGLSGDRLLAAALDADEGPSRDPGADSVSGEHAARPAHRRATVPSATRTFM